MALLTLELTHFGNPPNFHMILCKAYSDYSWSDCFFPILPDPNRRTWQLLVTFDVPLADRSAPLTALRLPPGLMCVFFQLKRQLILPHRCLRYKSPILHAQQRANYLELRES